MLQITLWEPCPMHWADIRIGYRGKLKLEKKKSAKFSCIFQYSNILIIKQISVSNLGWSINNVKTFATIMPKNTVFFQFHFGRGGLQSSSPPGAPMCFTKPVNQKCFKRIKGCMSSTLSLSPPPPYFALHQLTSVAECAALINTYNVFPLVFHAAWYLSAPIFGCKEQTYGLNKFQIIQDKFAVSMHTRS